MSELIDELHRHLVGLENCIRRDPTVIRGIKRDFTYLSELARNLTRLDKLRKAWGDIPDSVMEELGTSQSAGFVTIMLGAIERKYKMSQVSMVQWWRRMCATGQDHVLTYFSWKRLEETFTGTMLTGLDIIRVCSNNQDFLNSVMTALDDSRSIDFRVREKLGGISMSADVRKAWHDWAIRNHPDKGGNPEVFMQTKLVYEEWCELQKYNADNNIRPKVS